MIRLLILSSAIALVACSALTGEEVARLSINKVSTEGNLVIKEDTVSLKQGDEIVFWSEMDMAYEGDVALRFRISIEKDGEPYKNLEIDPTEKNLTLGEVKSTFGDQTTWSFSGQNGSFHVQEDGQYAFKAILVASENKSLIINKAEVVLKKV